MIFLAVLLGDIRGGFRGAFVVYFEMNLQAWIDSLSEYQE
jgi:hypothetical protein